MIYSLANHFFTMVAERRMPEIMGKSGRLDYIRIQTTPAGDHAE